MREPLYVKDLTVEDYAEMLERLQWLDALEAAGVDNWEGCDFAAEIFREKTGMNNND